MRTNIVIEDKLMRDDLRATRLKTKRENVDRKLRFWRRGIFGRYAPSA
ncbi:MAG: type II toxin-antitoxin system VapB family antitoxin [Acidobacteriia bacterium]|nr:type II toxin-antitoxin system VapB family antitoxin [Terriglobia bacterium]